MVACIFDLDMTLIDSKNLENLRRERNWREIYRRIDDGQVKEYNNISEILSTLRQGGVNLAIVTSAPKSYVKRIVNHMNWPIDVIVGYHDTKFRKPHPDPMNLAKSKLSFSDGTIFSFGDRYQDIVASKDSGCVSVACTWGTQNKESLLASSPEVVIDRTDQIVDVVFNYPAI